MTSFLVCIPYSEKKLLSSSTNKILHTYISVPQPAISTQFSLLNCVYKTIISEVICNSVCITYHVLYYNVSKQSLAKKGLWPTLSKVKLDFILLMPQ